MDESASVLAQTAAVSGPGAAITGLATWEDGSTRWVLASASGAVPPGATFSTTNGAAPNGSVAAFKLVDEKGKPALQPAWVSRDVMSPVTPLVINGVVFALSSGEAGQARAPQSKPAVLYALDATTGKELWNSGTAIATAVRGIAPSGGDSQVYVVTSDGVMYAFGIPAEH
jgi:outer membrane protein assembly factor BamB